MSLFFKDDLCEIHNGDSRDLLPSMPSGIVITDPPFNIGYKYDQHKDRMRLDEYQNLLKATLVCPCVIIHYPEQIISASVILSEIPTRIVAWVYPSNTGRMYRSIAWFGNVPNFKRGGQPYKNPKDKRVRKLIAAGRQCRLYDWWEINQVKNVSKEKTGHPCQMPLEVMMRIIRITDCKLVIDPFCGSGTTLLAAKKLGIKSIGIDKSPAYCQIAADRVIRNTF